jgi:outer membrane lipoprotein carrier protein
LAVFRFGFFGYENMMYLLCHRNHRVARPGFWPLLLFVCLLYLPSPAKAQGMRELERFMRTVQSAQGTFVQSVHNRSARKPQVATGQFSFQRPGQFRWAYETPYSHLLVSDGQSVWSYDPELKQVTVQALGQAVGQSPAAILAGQGDLEASFELDDEGLKEGLAWVKARPRQEGNPFLAVRLGFEPETGRLLVMWLDDHFGQQTELHLKATQINPRLEADLFRFTPPKGADVLHH